MNELLKVKLLTTFKMVFPHETPGQIQFVGEVYSIRDTTSGINLLMYYINTGILKAYYSQDIVLLCNVSSFSRFNNIWKIEQ